MFFKWEFFKNKDNKLDKQTPKLFGDGSIMSTLICFFKQGTFTLSENWL